MKLRILPSIALIGLSLLGTARADITTGLVGYWTLDEGSGSTVADSTSNGNTGTLTQFADTTFASAWTNDAWFNSAVIFNQNGETTNYINVPNSTSLGAPTTAKAWTLAAWVKGSVAGNAQTANAGLICKGLSGAEAYSLYINGSGKFTGNQRNASNGGGQSVSSTFVPAANTWYHVAVTFTTAGGTSKIQMVMYINGTNNANGAQNTYTTVYSTNLPVTIGCRASSSGTMTLPFKGILDDVRIYSRALPASDIFQIYTNNAPGSAHLPVIATQPRNVTCYSNDTAVFSAGVATTNCYMPLAYQWQLAGANISGATGASLVLSNVTTGNVGAYSVVITNYAGSVTSSPATLTVQSLPAPDTTSGLVGWWKFDDASGSSMAADSSGNGNAGSLANFTDTGFTSMWGGGLIDGALSFNGDGSAQNLVALPAVGTPAPAALDFSTSPVFTLSAWVQAALVQTNEAAIIAKGTGGGGEQYVLEVNGGNYRFFVRDANGTSYNISSTAPINGFWQHVAGVVNATNGNMNLYVNGALVASALAPPSLLANSHEVSIGNRQSGTANYGYAFTGAIDDVRIYSRALTAADVYQLYSAAGFPMITAQFPATYGSPYTLYAGSSPVFKLASVTGVLPFSYQWYTNGVADLSGTNASYQLVNLPPGNLTNYCVVTNSFGAATSFVWAAAVLAAPSAPYPQVVLADNPVSYWRLNEAPDNGSGNNGVVANDYRQGNSGLYANTILAQDGYSRGLSNQFGYFPATDPSETSPQFGYYPFYAGVSNFVGGIQGIDFSTPTNHTGNFSIEAWAKGDIGQSYNAGIVAKGAWASEQFTLDTGGTNYSYRFTLRDSGKQIKTVTSNTNAPDGNWHHLVGVLDEANSNACFYVDGVKVASASCSPSNGVFSTTLPVSIGARLGSTGKYDQQFFGNINDVAVYNYALSSAQVANHYLAAGIPPVITQNPVSSTNVNEGTTLTVAAQGAGGSQPVSYQWYDITFGAPGTPLAGQTAATLVINNISAALYTGHTLALCVSNAYGRPYSSGVSITVNSGAPLVSVTPSAATVYAGVPVVFKAVALGTAPISYQWSVNGTDVPGATGTVYTNTAGVGARTITCTAAGPGGSGSGSATLTGLTAPSDTYATRILADQPVAYWRLDEPLNAAVAYDYAGGHNGGYNNATNRLPGFSPSISDTAAGFGMNGVLSYSMVLEQDSSLSGVPTIDFSTQGTNPQFSVEAWVKAPPGQPSGGVCVVTKGNGHAEQFTLDVYGDVFRFLGRDSSGAVHTATSAFRVDGNWHHVVGVYDASNSVVNLFVDSILRATNVSVPALGLFSTSVGTSIGARTSSPTDPNYSLQLSNAVVDEVAVYGYALSSNQVVAHYLAAGLPPLIVRDLGTEMDAYLGLPFSLSVQATSASPMHYQWQRNGTNLLDGGTISGATTSTLTISPAGSSDAGTYRLVITNEVTTIPAVSTLATVAVLPQLGFNGFGGGWTSSGSPTTVPRYIAANVLRLTDGGSSEAASSFFSYPVYVGNFQASFTYQDVGVGGADGMAFVIQNDARGAVALGAGGGGLGYSGITNSAALEFNIYANSTVGYAVRTGGVTGKPYISASPVNLASGDPIAVSLQYLNGVLSLTLTDAVASASFTTNVAIDIPGAVGAETAYVGFTGADGGTASTQTVSDFAFVSLPGLSIEVAAGNQVTVSWPATVGGAFTLQQSSSLGSAWTPVGMAPVRVGDLYQVTVPAPGNGNTFYRLGQ